MPPPHVAHQRIAYRQLFLSLFLCFTLFAGVFSDWSFTPSIALAAARPHVTPGALTFQQFLKQKSHDNVYHGRFIPPQKLPPPPISSHDKPAGPPLPSAEPPTMKPFKQTLDTAFLTGAPGTQPLDLMSNDKRLEVEVQAGAFDLSHATVAKGIAFKGSAILLISEVHGRFVGENTVLGEYQLQLTDVHGRAINGVLVHTPITLIYHYQKPDIEALGLDPGHLFLVWPELVLTATKKHQSFSNAVIALHNDPKTHTLTAQTPVFGPGPFDFTGDPVNQSPPIPNLASVQGNAGQISYSYPIEVPAGPDGFGPNLSLNYSSEIVNERHSFTQPGNSIGDGWSLSLGSITADVHDPNSDGGALTWYNLSGVDNVSDRLVPNPKNPAQFLTQHLTPLKIQMTNNCFQVWDPSGTYYEFGCTPSSQQYHKDSDGTIHLYRWDLDKIIAPNEGNSSSYKYLTVSYLQDCVPFASPCPTASNAPNGGAIRDAAVKQITVFAGSTITATVDFLYQAPNAVSLWANAYGTNYNTYPGYSCTPPGSPGNPTGKTTLRCDDPVNYSGGAPAPVVMSTLSLQKITSYVGPDSGSGSSIAYSYGFKYLDTPFTAFGYQGMQCADPTSGSSLPEYCAAEHLLTSVTPTAYQGGTGHQLRSVVFDYTKLINSYSDQSQTVPGTSNKYAIHVTWQYLSDYLDTDDGVGGHIVYETGYGNTHGTPNQISGGNLIDDRHDPTYCFTWGGCTNQYAYPDDQQWTAQIVTQTTLLGADSNAFSAATTNYYYHLNVIGTGCPAAGSDTDCVRDNWTPGGTDWQDFYDSEFHGFQGVFTTSPTGNLTEDLYFTTEGPGTASANSGNYDAGNLYEEDTYSGNSTSGPLLRKTTNEYAGNDKTSSACNGTYSGVYTPCEVMVIETRTAQCEGASGCTTADPGPWAWPMVITDNTYDDYSKSSGLGAGYHNLLQETVTPNDAPTVTYIWNYKPDDQTIGNTVYYDVNKVVESEVDDSSGYQWQCEGITYDEGNGSGVPAGYPVAGWPTTVKQYDHTNCTYPSLGTPLTTTYTGYDAFGNVAATVDGVAAANSNLYGSTGQPNYNGCTLPTNPAIMSSAWGKTNYTACSTYDASYARLLTSTNAFGQTISTQYDDTQAGGLPIKVTDLNNEVTSTTYTYNTDSRTVQQSQPGEAGSYTTQTTSNSACPTSLPNGSILFETPCYQMDSNSSLYPNAISQTFYDALGRAVESSTPIAAIDGGISGTYYYSVVLTEYRDDATHSMWQTVPFVVVGSSTGVGWLDPNASSTKDYKGNAPTGTATYFDALDRPIATQDPMFGMQGVPGIPCAPLGGNATACTIYGTGMAHGDANNVYATTTSIDPNNHVAMSFTDGLGRTRYAQNDSGVNGGTLAPNEQTAIQYNVLDEPTSVTETDLAPQSGQTITSVTASATYDDIGRLTGVNDPDRGNDTYTLDPNGNVLSDVSGTRTIGYNYDLLGRLGCIQDAAPTINATGTCTTGTHPYVQNTYDISAPNAQWGSTDYPVGRLTQSIATTYNPDGGAITATQNIQYDQRGQAITEQLKLGLPSGWNVTNALPTYQMAVSYNDANQPATMATSTVKANGNSTPGYTVTNVYDSTAGTLVGLSNNGNPTANVATLLYNEYALVDTVNFQTNTGTALANEQFGYDGDLRATSAAANWQSGSGTSGQFFSQSIFYDPASNVTSESSGFSGAGSSETSNFCYDEQNRLVWSGNSSAPPSPGNGTCGNQTPSSGLSGSGYTNSFAYTHLGQLWQGPLNGSSTQYLYCSSSHQHQLTGMYPIGTTCSNLSGAVYTSSYDAWGNVTGRSYAGTSSTQTFDMLNRLTKWYVGSSSKEFYGYDAAGDRVVLRSVNGGATSITVYTFGSEEYTYDGTGNLQSSTHYYSLGGQLVGALTSTSTNMFLTDALGSVLESFSTIAGSAAVEGNQTFSPYGTPLHSQGSMGTNLAFTGQYHDALTGFDYYGARYYDPVAGVFLSADILQGNLAGADPYTYVGGNPETFTDPTGNMYAPHSGEGGGGSSPPPSHPNSNTNPGGGGIFGDIGSIFSGGVQIVEHATGEIAKIVADPETDPAIPIIQKIATTVVAAEPEIEVVSVDALDFTEFAVCPLCAGAVMIISFLANPTPLASGTLSTPISTTGGVSPGTGGESVNIVAHDSNAQPQAGGGGQGNKPPGGTKPTASPPDEPNGQKLPPDLYRGGNAKGPMVDKVREFGDPRYKKFDVHPDEDGNICPGEGISTFDKMGQDGPWWRLPAGTELPEGLQFNNDTPHHWLIEPSSPMSVDAFKQLLRQITGWERCS
ncbi:MAG TPA: RHS repeat-associated core domain-containing protein [Ktedonobacteraceae bacterium]|nr:RHS repeat-associated core domain-containing protein [Ktedonobacteraceae bacterium]